MRLTAGSGYLQSDRQGRFSPLCSHSSIVRRRSGSSKADPHRSLLKTWLRNRLHCRDGVDAGGTFPDANEELEKLTQNEATATKSRPLGPGWSPPPAPVLKSNRSVVWRCAT